MKWISVEERFPISVYNNISHSVLITDGSYVIIGHYCHKSCKWEESDRTDIPDDEVTHWMELPEPPVGKETENQEKE